LSALIRHGLRYAGAVLAVVLARVLVESLDGGIGGHFTKDPRRG